jgi:hypothetical protein
MGRSHLLDRCVLGSLAYDPPDHLLADTRAPHGAAARDRAEDQPVLNACNRHPFIYYNFYPVGTGTVRTCPYRTGQRPVRNRAVIASHIASILLKRLFSNHSVGPLYERNEDCGTSVLCAVVVEIGLAYTTSP